MSKVVNKKYKKIALALSLCILIIWGILGTGASLAWFTDTSDKVTNIFHTGDFELTVSHRTDDGSWEIMDGNTKVFDDEALYEPGYVQVVYLKIENTGDYPFDFHTAVSVRSSVTALNMFGQEFWLHEHLKFGVVFADSESEMDELVSNRDKAVEIANMKLQNYDTKSAALEPGVAKYMALVVRMPKNVGNEANYRGDNHPKVELGIIVKADQQR